MGMSRKAQNIGGAAILAVLAIVGVLTWLLTPDERSTDDIAAEIKAWARDHTPAGHGAIRVSCPDPVEWRVGETFRCVVSQGKQSLLVVVTMENDAGYVTWQAG